MTLSPSRSSRNFLDSPNTRSPSPWVPRTTFIRTVFPVCFVLLFAASIYFYTRITTQSLDYATSPSMDVSGVSASYYSRQWLLAQVKMLANNEEKYHPGIPHETLMQADPFSRSSGINVWDYYPPQLSCPDVERVGKVGEGGKWVCGLTQLATEETCIIYSFGISTDISFEVELLLRTKCVIHAFDPTVGKLPYNKLRPDLLAAMTPDRRARLHFHKTALGTRSASTEVHSYNEQLYDIMHRLGHSFINLLKVDIEGGEWSVFHSLFTEFPNRARGAEEAEGMSLPVGQLVIELHYHTMQSIEHFFSGAEAFGLLPFSREINLQPCIAGGSPVAAEYSFLHVENYFAGASRVQRIPAPHTHSWHVPIKAVIYFLTQRARVDRMAGALQMLFDNFWQDYPHYPVVLFHDDLTAADERVLQQAVPRMKLRFVAITLTLPDNLPAGLHIPDRTVCAPGSSTLGYRHMCRFHATGVHKYLGELGYAQFDYIMRLDDDSLLKSPVGYDLFRYMRENKKLYAFPNLLADEANCVTDLWEKSEEFFNATVSNRSVDSLFYAWPKGVVFYNNFEISAVSLWHHPIWRAYMAYIDSLGGIYSLRWGDAPLHTIGVTMILDTAQVHAFTDIAYAHAPFVDQTPRGLPMPHMDPFVGPNVDCSYYDKWMCKYTEHGHAHNMTNGTLDSHGNLIFNHSYSLGFVPKDLRTRSIYYINATAQAIEYERLATYFAALEKMDKEPKEPPMMIASPGKDAALFTFAHGGREKLLALTLQSFYDHYLVHHPAPVVLFFSERGTFQTDVLKSELRASGVLPLLVFRAVTLVDTTSAYVIESSCTSHNEEVRGSSEFLRYEAVRMLKSMGYSWMFRFGDDARLRKPTKYNIFEKMHQEGAVYGYKSAMDERGECVDGVWKLGESLCGADGEVHARNRTISKHGRRATGDNSHHARRLLAESATGARQGSACGGMVADWTPHRVILTSFEISHVSVWDAPYCQRLFAAASHERAAKTLPLWGDSALHTICVVHTLPASRVTVLHELDYMFNWGNSEWKDLESRDQTNLFQSTPLESHDRAFGVQRVGWLGGDIAASFPLPDPADPAAAPRTAIWLFGDSIIGVSTPERRIGEYHNMVSNTIGVASISSESAESTCVREVSRVDYFWNTDGTGTPQPILTMPQHSTCQSGQQRLWPIAGVAVLSAEGTTTEAVTMKALLIVQVICVDPTLNAAGLQFRTYDTALVVVSNPLASPQAWRYHAKVFSAFGKQKIHWMSLSDAKAGAFARNGGNLYLVGAVVNSDGTGLADGYQVLGKAPAESLLALDLSVIEVMSAVAPLTGSAPAWFHPYPTSGEKSEGAALVPHKLFKPLLTEASVHYDSRHKEWLVVSLLMVDERVQLCRTADLASPTASMNCTFIAAATPKAVRRPGNMVSYAAKAHHYLLNTESCKHTADAKESTPALELVVTYNTNALEADTLFAPQMLGAYTPKFLHIREDRNRRRN